MRVAVALAAAAVFVSGASAAATFTPRTLAGTWNGSWTDDASGDSGPAVIKVTASGHNTKLAFSVNFGGSVFGCTSVPPESTRPLPMGTGVNHWNAHGFVLRGRSKAFGTLTIRYRAASGNVSGSGVDPPCAHGVSWTMIGAFVGSTFSGKVRITLANGHSGISDISLTRG